MMPIDLLDACKQSMAHGGTFIVLTVPYRRPRGERTQVMPGLYGRILGSNSNERTIVSLKIDDVTRWMVKHLSQIELWAVTAMEAGDHEVAAERLRQFELVRDRLADVVTTKKRPRARPSARDRRRAWFT